MSIMNLLPVIDGGGKASGFGDVTWELTERGVGGKISGGEAVCQAAKMALSIPRYRHLIYSWQYGSELEELVGRSFEEVKRLAPGMIREALMQDDRVQAVGEFSLEKSGDGSVDIRFMLQTKDGVLPVGWRLEAE